MDESWNVDNFLYCISVSQNYCRISPNDTWYSMCKCFETTGRTSCKMHTIVKQDREGTVVSKSNIMKMCVCVCVDIYSLRIWCIIFSHFSTYCALIFFFFFPKMKTFYFVANLFLLFTITALFFSFEMKKLVDVKIRKYRLVKSNMNIFI